MKKLFVFLVLVIAGIGYIHSHYTVGDVLAYAQKKADPRWTPKIEYYVGYYYLYEDQAPDAIKTLESLLTDYPDTEYKPNAVFHLGEAYEANRNKSKAMELYQQYLDDNPGGSFASLAKQKIDVIKSS